MTSTQHGNVWVGELSCICILFLSRTFKETFSCYLPFCILIRVLPASDAEWIYKGLLFGISVKACSTSCVDLIRNIQELLWFNLSWLLLLWAQRGESMGKRVINSLRRCIERSRKIIWPRVLGHSLEETHPLRCTDLVLEIAQTIGLVGRWWTFANRWAFIWERRHGWVYSVVLRWNICQACSLRPIR